MNIPIRRVAVVSLLMFLTLMVASTWIQFVQAPSLNADGRNVRTLYRAYGTDRGPIVVGGESIALSTPVDDPFKYQRSYPDGPLYAHVSGYYSVVSAATGIERFGSEYLNGSSDSLWWSRVQNLISGEDPQGSAVELTIVPAMQQAAWDALGDQRGAVVALDPTTGAILAMVSKPSFDPNPLAVHSSKEAGAAYAALDADEGRPLINRAIGGDTYPPGSTFKLVTAAAALEAGSVDADTQIAAPTELPLPQSSSTLPNFGGAACSDTGTTTLADALRTSCNTAFAQLGMDLGDAALAEQATAFGFETDLAVPMRVTPSRFPTGEDGLGDAETALAAIGQASVRTTPLQVAMISAAIANGGELMTPYLIEQVRTPDLDIAFSADPSVLSTPVSEDTASALRDMMVDVVQSGTGTSAQIQGVQVAGKTGTAEHGQDKSQAPHAWFTGFAPADDPRVVVAVVVENGGNLSNEATGGRVAAPIARAVLQAGIDR